MKSTEPKYDQIRRQITAFVKTDVLQRKIISMDQCKDYIQLEKAYGAVPLGADADKPKVVTFVDEENKKPPDPLWQKLSEVLHYTPSKMSKFKLLID